MYMYSFENFQFNAIILYLMAFQYIMLRSLFNVLQNIKKQHSHPGHSSSIPLN
jgi:hypothetical protein